MESTGYYNFDDVRSLNISSNPVSNQSDGPISKIVKIVVKYSIIAACTAVCMYLLYGRAVYFTEYETTVSVNVRFVQELRNILPGITICSGSFISLKNLLIQKPALKVKLDEISSKNLGFSEEYIEKHKAISTAVNELLNNLPLKDYFDPKNGLVTSKELITWLMCDRQTWKRSDGKNLAKYSLNTTCDNVYKIRSIDRANGLCFTLFHESALVAVQKTNRESKFGRDEINTPDPEELALFTVGFYTPPQFEGNGLLTLKVNYNFEPIKIGPNQSTTLDTPYGGKFWIHPNRNVPKMSTIGYQLEPGRHYTIYIRKSIANLMKPPYVTNCRNYTEEYLSKMSRLTELMDLSVPMSRETCIDECIAKNAVENHTHCGCWPPVLPYRKDNQTEKAKNLRFCSEDKAELCYTLFEGVCRSECPNDCRDEFYETIIKEKPSLPKEKIEYLFASTPKNLQDEKIHQKYNLYQPETIIDIVFASNEETYHDHSAALELIDLVVDMAGLFGLFLSLSAVHLIDAYEFLREKIRDRVQVGI